jgi:protein TonB
MIEMAKFTPPKIVKDEEVEEPPPAQEELKEAKIDVVTQEGIKDEGIVAPTVIDEGKQIIEEKKEDENKIFEKVEIEASFKGGEGAWKKYLERNLNANAPIDNGAPEGSYTVYIQFVVSKDGSISDVKPLTNHGYGMEAEAVRVVKKGPAWVPAVQNGRSVNAYRKQPITFQVTAE